MTVGDWIRAERQKRQPPDNTQGWLAEQMGVGQTTVSKWETGKSDVSRDELARLEYIFGSTYQTDKISPQTRITQVKLAVMGTLRARQRLERVSPAALEYIAAPPGIPPGGRAVIVRGASLPPHRDGTALVFWAFVSEPAAFVGELCYVKLASGEEYVREIQPGLRSGTWDLVGPPGEEIIAGVTIVEVAPIEWTIRKPTWINTSE